MATILKLSANEREFVASMERASGALGKFTADMNLQLAKSLSKIDNVNTQLNRGFGRLSNTLKSISVESFIAITVPLGLAAKFGSDAYAEYDGLKKALGVLEPTLAGVNDRLRDLREIAKAPGIGFQEAIQGEVRLRNAGFTIKESNGILKEFANTIALTGGGAIQLNEVTYQLSQMASKGKVLSQDLRPIIEAAPAVSAALKKMFGTVASDDISDILTKRGESSTDFIRQLVAEMEKGTRVGGGWKTTLENAKDSLFVMGATTFEVADKVFNLQSKIQGLVGGLENMMTGFLELSPAMQGAILGTLGVIAVLPVVTFAMAKLIDVVLTLQKTMLTLRGVFGIVSLAVGVLAGAYIAHRANVKDLEERTKSLSEVHKDSAKSVGTQTTTLNSLVESIKKTKVGSEEYLNVKRQILQISPKFAAYLTDTKANYVGLAAAAKQYANSLVDTVTAQKIAENISKNKEQLADIKKNPFNSLDTFEDVQNIGLSSAKAVGSGILSLTGLPTDPLAEFKKSSNTFARDIAKERSAILEKSIKEGEAALENLSKKLVSTETVAPITAPVLKSAKDGTTEKIKEVRDSRNKEFNALIEDQEKSIEKYRNRQSLLKEITDKPETTSEAANVLKTSAKGFINDSFDKGGVGASSDTTKFFNAKIDEFTKGRKGLENAQARLVSELDKFAKQSDLDLQNDQQKALEKLDEQNKTDTKNLAESKQQLLEQQNQLITEGISDLASGGFAQLINGESQGFDKALKRQLNIFGNYAIQLGIAGKKIALLKSALFADPTIGTSLALIAGGIALKAASASIKINKFARGAVTTQPVFAMLGDNPSGKEMALPFERNQEFATDIAKYINNSGGGVAGGELRTVVRGKDLDLILTRYRNGN